MVVPYTQQQTAMVPQGNTGLQNVMSGIQAGSAIKGFINEKKQRREVDRIFSELGNETPNQEQFVKIARLMGPDMADQLLKFHDRTREWKAHDRATALSDAAIAADFAGTIADTLSTLPPEQRAGAFSDLMNQYGSTTGNQQATANFVKPLLIHFRDGDFSDERLDVMKMAAFSFGRYQEVQDAKIKREELKGGNNAAGGGGGKPSDKRDAMNLAKENLAEFGGNLASHYAHIMGQSPKELIGDDGTARWVLPQSNQPYDLGTMTQSNQTGDDPLDSNEGDLVSMFPFLSNDGETAPEQTPPPQNQNVPPPGQYPPPQPQPQPNRPLPSMMGEAALPPPQPVQPPPPQPGIAPPQQPPPNIQPPPGQSQPPPGQQPPPVANIQPPPQPVQPPPQPLGTAPQGRPTGLETQQTTPPGTVDDQDLDRLIQIESGNDPNAISPKGAVGLTQVLPKTAIDPGFGVKSIFDIADEMEIPYEDKTPKSARELLLDPEANKAFGKSYLEAMLKRYDGDMIRALIAYNAGPKVADNYKKGEMANLPKETVKYLADWLVLKNKG